ncbi:MAG: flavodoxin family protein [candidate division FCPU426 bacterium]
MPPLLLALLGSPRPQGACAQMLRAFCAGASNWKIKKINLFRLHIRPCLGCESCQKSRICRHVDDMVELFRWLDQAQAVVLSAPVYFYGLPAPTKAVVDRCHPLWHDPYWQQRHRRPGFLLSACGRNLLSEFDILRRETIAFFNTIGCRLEGEVLLPGRENKDASKRLTAAIRKSRHLARRL